MNIPFLDQFKYILNSHFRGKLADGNLVPHLSSSPLGLVAPALTNPPFPVSLLFISTLTGQIFSLTDLSWDYKFRVNSERDIFIKPRSFVVARHEHCRFNYLKSRFTAIFGGLQQWQQWGQGALSHL